MANVVVSALATWNGKALKKAKQDVNVFDKQIKKLGRTFGLTFSAAALVSFSKKAIKAFTDDEAAAKRLQLQLENTGNAFRVTEVEAYIKSLEKTLGILDDLRAPFQTFLNATGSVELAQRSLEAALDISAGTGESLGTVVNAISAGIRGNTKAIKNLNTGIDQNIIATGDMNKIMAALEKRFAGQSLARLDTYAGKMDVLKKGVDEATKSIGTGLVDALVILSKDESVASLADDFENLGDNIAYAIVEMAKLIKKFDDLVDNPQFQAGLLTLAILSRKPKAVVGAMGLIGLNAAGNALTRPRTTASTNMGGYSGIPNLKAAKELLKVTKDSVKFRKLENEQLKKKTAVDQLKDKFDLERIGLTQALNAATDEEVKLRLRSQLAILDNNEALAKKLLAEMEAAEGLKKFTDELASSTDKFSAMVSKLVNEFMAMGLSFQQASALAHMSARYQAQADAFAAGGSVSGMSIPSSRAPLNKISSGAINPQQQFTSSAILADLLVPATVKQSEAIMASMSARYQAQADTYFAKQQEIKLTIDTSSTNDRFSQLIAESIQAATKTGLSTSPVGSLP
jgi:ribosomal protein L7Ae-like RNA K-turn-binding protein